MLNAIWMGMIVLSFAGALMLVCYGAYLWYII